MYKRFKSYFIQGALDRTDDIFERAQIEATFNINFGFTILYALMLMHFSTLETSFEFDFVNYISGLWTLSIIFTLKWTKSYVWPGLSFVVMGMFVSTTMIFIGSGAAYAETGVWHTFGILTAFLLLNRTIAYIIGLYYILMTIFVIVNNANGLGFFDVGWSFGKEANVGEDPVPITIPMVATLYMLGYFMLTRKKAQRLIAEQKEKEQNQRILLEEKNYEITSSITYAKRIQEAILPARRKWLDALSTDSFVLYKPKDIVAGDFYWLEKSDGQIILAAADCTGHGVPGAMVSVVCHNALNRAVREFRLTRPAAILDKTQELVIETFEQSEGEVKDGMDVSVISLDRAQGKIRFAGAHNSLYYIRRGELHEVKADKQPIGQFENRKPFTEYDLNIEAGDCYYLFTDGYPDQFGGPKGKKFKYKQLKEVLLNFHLKPMDEQKDLLDKTFESWRGNLEQVDDVCIIGIRV